MRALFALVLSLVLALASQTEAVARSEMAGARDQVLCSGFGAVTVTLDASGHRIASHPCTHCLAASAAMAEAAGPVLVPQAPARFETLRPETRAQTRFHPLTRPMARGPPRDLI